MRKLCTGAAAGVSFVVTILMVLATPAVAHTGLASSDPADETVLTEPLDSITFVFTEPIEPFIEGFEITDIDGADVPIDAVDVVDGTTVIVRPEQPITRSVVATWAIESGDSHVVTGVIVLVADEAAMLRSTAITTTTNAATTTPTTTTTTTTSAVVATGAAPSTVAPSTTAPSTTVPTTTVPTTPTPTTVSDGVVEEAGGLSDDLAAELDELRSVAASEPGWPGWLAAAVRLLGYGAAVLVFGAVAVGLERAGMLDVRNRMTSIGAVAMIVSGPATVISRRADLTGDVGELFDVAGLVELLDGRLLVGVSARILGGVVLLLVAVRWPDSGRVRAAGLGLALVSFALLSHAASGSWAVAGAVAVMVHVAAVSVWAGGVIALLVVARRTSRSMLAELASDFGRAAAWALGAVVVVGVVLSVLRLDSLGDLIDTPYGQRLLLKVAVVAGAVTAGAAHRFVTIPRMQERRAGSTMFSRVAAIEALLFVVVLVVTAVLVGS